MRGIRSRCDKVRCTGFHSGTSGVGRLDNRSVATGQITRPMNNITDMAVTAKPDKDLSSGRNHVLVLRWDASNVDSFVSLFEKQGFTVHSCVGRFDDSIPDHVGAVVHLARSADALATHLGDELQRIDAEEWLLVAGDGEDDFHCTVQLTGRASMELRNFVRWLWAVANIA